MRQKPILEERARNLTADLASERHRLLRVRKFGIGLAGSHEGAEGGDVIVFRPAFDLVEADTLKAGEPLFATTFVIAGLDPAIQ